ncbi:MAG: ribonuclease HI family protein [Candidatus Peribacteraceae bacterium]|nr:ribonuclease HI family protein [Candidatus Peribacteraceae bacterium]
MRLPVALEKKLAAIFPTARQREQFVIDVISKALENPPEPSREMQPTSIGGSLHLFTDGGSRGNPGQAAVGCVLLEPDGTVLKEFCETIGIQTNNIAEYKALIAGLKMAQEFQPNHLICHLDSELVVKQVNGEYRVKMVTFQPLIDEINRLKNQFKSVQVVYVPRAQNSRADALVNKALDGR